MTINEINGNLFDQPNGTYYVQSVSSDLALGAGIALEFNSLFDIREKLRSKYPNGVVNFNGWRNCCVFEYPVFNLVVKELHQGKPTYKTLERSLVDMRNQIKEMNISEISMPMISTGLDKLEWKKVRKVIYNVFKNTDITINVYSYGDKLFESKKIEIYPSHIEVRPFYEGDLQDYLKKLSKYDEVKRKYLPFGYTIENDILYLPRGMNVNELQRELPGSTISNYEEDFYRCKRFEEYYMLYPPRDELQESIIDFLLHKDYYARELGCTRFVLNCATDSGKTYCMVNAIINRKIKSLIICHQNKIQAQWIETFKTKTSMPSARVISIDSSDIIEDTISGNIQGDVFIVTHQMINSYAKNYGWDRFNLFINVVGFGIKVFDEAHLFFESVLRIDANTNVYETYYLTATFQRSSAKENTIFKRAFDGSCKFDGSSFDKRRHVIYIPIIFNSKAPDYVAAKMQNKYGFSAVKYIDYALNIDEQRTLMSIMIEQFKKTESVPGSTLIVSPTIESSNVIAKIMKDITNKKVGVVNSSIDDETKLENQKSCEVISSTIKSSGTGVDIKGLRFLHCLEPHMSMNITIQLAGRLREYSPTDYTYFFDYFDMSVPHMDLMYKNHMRAMKKRAYKISQLIF